MMYNDYNDGESYYGNPFNGGFSSSGEFDGGFYNSGEFGGFSTSGGYNGEFSTNGGFGGFDTLSEKNNPPTLNAEQLFFGSGQWTENDF